MVNQPTNNVRAYEPLMDTIADVMQITRAHAVTLSRRYRISKVCAHILENCKDDVLYNQAADIFLNVPEGKLHNLAICQRALENKMLPRIKQYAIKNKLEWTLKDIK